MKNGKKLKLGDATPVSPQEISKRYKRKSLGLPKASPSSIKSSGLSRHFVFIVSCTAVLFLEHLSFRLLCLVCLVCLNKVVWTPVLTMLFQISQLVLEMSRKFLLGSVRGACIDCDLDFSMTW